MTALKPHFIQVLVFSNFNHQPLGQGVDDGNPHTVQPTAGFIGVAAKFTARMQRGHNDLQCRLVFVFGMLVNRNAATIVADGQRAIGRQMHCDPAGVASDRFIHRVVEHFGKQVMQGPLICAANIHAGTPPHGLQTFQHLNIFG